MQTSPTKQLPALGRLATPSDAFPNAGCSYRPPPDVIPWSASDESSFAYESVVKRWPTILTGVIDQLHKEISPVSPENHPDRVAEAKDIISKIGALKYESARDKMISPLIDDGGSGIDLFNSELARTAAADRGTWFTASWLFCECYLYRRLRTMFAPSKHWKEYDPFAKQKLSTFKSSADGIFTLAQSFGNLVEGRTDAASDLASEEAMEAAFLEMSQVSLWGNATDLSLLTHLTPDEIRKLQRTGKAAQQEASASILQNDLSRAWKHLRSLTASRVDFVLDNAGFELYCDLVFADWMTTCTPHVKTVVFHPKNLPWFVSDVVPRDFNETLLHLLDPSFFDCEPSQLPPLHAMVRRWQSYLDEGRWRLGMPSTAGLGEAVGEVGGEFWTNPLPFWALPERAPGLLSELQKSNLVIFKGDLNYRKLTGDCTWTTTTPFDKALGPLAGNIDILSLRTLKADVVVGLAEGAQERLDEEDPRWRVNGRFAVCAFSGRAGHGP